MTPPKKILIPIADIIIGNRQRQDLGDIEGMAASLKAHGQIQAIGINAENKLIWGRRRLAGATLLGWEKIEAVRRVDLTPLDEQLLEWEEDFRQKPRNWQEKCVALSSLFFKLKNVWMLEKGENWTRQMMCDFTGINGPTSVFYMIKVAEELKRDPDGEMSKCSSMRDALRIFAERSRVDAVAEQERRRQQAAVDPNKGTFAEPGFTSEGVDTDIAMFEGAVSTSPSTVEYNEIRIYGYRPESKGYQVLDCSAALLNRYDEPSLYPDIVEALKDKGAMVSWMSPGMYLNLYKEHPLIWHTPGDLRGTGFAPDYKMGIVQWKSEKPDGPPISSVMTAPLRDDKMLPTPIVWHLLNALTQDGDLVLCLGYVNPADVAALGRIPVFVEENETLYKWKVEQLKAYYTDNIPNVKFI